MTMSGEHAHPEYEDRLAALQRTVAAHIDVADGDGNGGGGDGDGGGDGGGGGGGGDRKWFAPEADANTAFLFADKTDGQRWPLPGYAGVLNLNGGVDDRTGEVRNRWTMPIYAATAADPIVTVRVRDRGDWYVGGEFTIRADRARMPTSLPDLDDDSRSDANLAIVDPTGETAWDLYAADWESDTLLTCRVASRFNLSGSAWFAIDGWPRHRIAEREARDGHSGTRACGIFPPFGNIPGDMATYSSTGLPYMLGLGAGPLILGGPSGPPGNRNEDYVFPALRADWRAAETYRGWTPMGSVLTTDRDRSPEMDSPAGRALAKTALYKGLLIQDFAGVQANLTLYAALDFHFDQTFWDDFKRLGQWIQLWRQQ